MSRCSVWVFLLVITSVSFAADQPLSAERQLRFTTSEVTWRSLDVSPDDKSIVFDTLGDLYTVSIKGGVAKPLSRGLAWDAQPRYSPDGKHIVYVSDANGAQNLWIMQANGQNARILTQERFTTFQSPEWTPDGRAIVAGYDVGRNYQALKLFPLDGSAAQGLGVDKESSVVTRGPAFGNNSNRIFYAFAAAPRELEMGAAAWQIAVLDLRSGVSAPVTEEPGSAFRPTLSQDGQWLVYGSRDGAETGLRVRNLSSGAERWLVPRVDRDHQEMTANLDLLPGMAFTPDSKYILANFSGKIQRIDIATGKATPIEVQVPVEIGLGELAQFSYRVDEGPVKVRQIRTPRLSPDGKQTVFVALNRLWLVNGTEQPRRLTSFEVGEFEPTYSPDGKFIAFITWTEKEGGQIYRVAADGRGKPQRLNAAPGYFSALEYSPDGSRLVVLRAPWRHGVLQGMWGSGAASGLELAWLPATGGELTTITPVNRGYVSMYDFGFTSGTRPHFAQDPDRIYFYDAEQGLTSVKFDGSERRRHFKVTGPAYEWVRSTPQVAAEQVQISPDGCHALIELTDRHVYRAAIPAATVDSVPTIALDFSQLSSLRVTTIGGYDPRWNRDGTFSYALGSSIFNEQGEKLKIALTVPRQQSSGSVALRGARIVSMRGAEVIENGVVLIQDGRITALGSAAQVSIPSEAKILDVAGKTIIPGLVDVHAHMSPPTGIHATQPWQYAANLAYGITTALDPYSEIDAFTYEDLVAAGRILGPRAYSTGPGINTVFGKQVESIDDVRNLLRRYSEYYGTHWVKQYMFGDRREQQWFIQAAREQRLMTTTEGGTTGWQWNLTQIVDGYPRQEHNLAWPFYADFEKLYLESGVSHSSQLLTLRGEGAPSVLYHMLQREDILADTKLLHFTPRAVLDSLARRRRWAFDTREMIYPRWARDMGRLIAKGGRVAVGNHGNMIGLGTHWEMWLLTEGMTNHDALRAGTIFGAEHLGLSEDLGSLEPGKIADLLVLDANPLEQIRNTVRIKYVMKGGVMYAADSLDQIWPQAVKQPVPWWHEIPAATAQ
jgi:Tol biopolymer transport system component